MGCVVMCSVTIKVRGMAGDTLTTRRMTYRAAFQCTGYRCMTGSTGRMDLTAADKRAGGGHVTAGCYTG